MGMESRSDDQFDRTFRLFRFQFGTNALGKGTQIHRRMMHLHSRESREFQHVINQSFHAQGSRAYPAQKLLAPLIQLIKIVFEKRQAESIDATQWSAEIVRDRIAKRSQLVVGSFELSGSFGKRLGAVV